MIRMITIFDKCEVLILSRLDWIALKDKWENGHYIGGLWDGEWCSTYKGFKRSYDRHLAYLASDDEDDCDDGFELH